MCDFLKVIDKPVQQPFTAFQPNFIVDVRTDILIRNPYLREELSRIDYDLERKKAYEVLREFFIQYYG